MRYLYRAFARVAPLQSAHIRLATLSPPWRLPYRHIATQTFEILEAAEMGKEKTQFQLKTPKGTKDCRHTIGPLSRALATNVSKGKAKTWSFATASLTP